MGIPPSTDAPLRARGASAGARRRLFGLLMLAALVVLAAIWMAPATAPADDSTWLYGIHWYGDTSGSVVEAMTGGKGIWTLEIVLPYSDPWWQAGGQLAKYQQIVARGHTIICRLHPNWGYAVPQPPNTPDLAQYLLDVTATANTLKDVVHVWQIGNEMNLNGEWGGAVLTAPDYVADFKQIRGAIKSAVSPLGEQMVLLGPVSPGGMIPGIRHTDGNVYLSQMCDLLTGNDLDGFSIHGYAGPWNNAAAARAEFQAGYVSQLAVIDQKGFAAQPVHMTEWNRRVEPIDDYNEAQSAQFLHGAFTDLDAWNHTPGAHPISSACWFIYADDPNWTNYSILHLRGIGPGGSDNDLWDAFQYACTLDYPTVAPSGGGQALMYAATPPGTNVALASVGVVTDSNHDGNSTGDKAIDGVIDAGSKWASAGTSPPHWLQLDLGSAQGLSGLVVRHAGAGGEPDYFNTEAFQLQTAPSASGPWGIEDTVFNAAQSNSTARSYYVSRTARHVRLFITDPGIDAWARIPEFEVYAADPGDFNDDGDVDLGDFADFQACFGGTDVIRTEPACFFAHFDDDQDVDLDDLQGFLGVFTGPAG
ncbi:MAG: discoidin domain-containing protein [bacterium]|nr:discoidin domain-containing protein [bacterium]